MHSAHLRFDCPGRASIVRDSIAVEAEDGPEGTTTSLGGDADHVVVDVTAMTVSDMRAALNGIVRLLDAADRVTR